jgi:hypothetical protein
MLPLCCVNDRSHGGGRPIFFLVRLLSALLTRESNAANEFAALRL